MIQFQAYKQLSTSGGKMPLDIAFTMQEGELVALYGSSGAGKTTVLRILAGLTKAASAYIEAGGQTWNDSRRNHFLPVQKRNVGFVFQDFALFPNLTVRENLAFARHKNTPAAIIDELLEMMELEQLQKRRPANLSGGQKQRVALARAIAQQPKLLLLDEPLSAIDNDMRSKLQDYILKAHRQYKLTTILVSHNLAEVFRLADKVLVLDKGRIVTEGTPAAVFLQDKTATGFSIMAEVVAIKKADTIYLISLLAGNQLVNIPVTEKEAGRLQPGSKVMVSTGSFNPVIQLIT